MQLQPNYSPISFVISGICTQVENVCECGRELEKSYAGPDLAKIVEQEKLVQDAWDSLLSHIQKRAALLSDALDKFKFLNLVRDLLSWLESVLRQINAQERPK